ncbi:MAG: thioesterase family protein [Actinobacteria bacterium]|nr:thioesterase family protein [Actinomycetota bacterium]
MTEALFTRVGDLFHPTPLTEGPWSPDAQHGGPPAALLAGAIEKAPSDTPMLVARVSVELLRPVPLRPLRLVTEVTRPGRKVQLVSAVLIHEDNEVARALGLRIRRAGLDTPFPVPEAVPPPPETGRPPVFFTGAGGFATKAMEIMMIEGDFTEAGPGKAWLRLRVPLVEGEPTTGVERVAAAADFGNGISNLAGPERNWVFINPDLVIRLTRDPVGEWVFLDSATTIQPTGVGLATSTISDMTGSLGVAAQTLFVEPM